MPDIICADVMEGLAGLENESVQCCVTSPPYFGTTDRSRPGTYKKWLASVFRLVRRKLREDATLWLVLGDSCGGFGLFGVPWKVALRLCEDRWGLQSEIIWHRPHSVISTPRHIGKCHEHIFLFSKSDAPMLEIGDGPEARSVWEIPANLFSRGFEALPDALITRCIRAGSREGDTVLDPFCGAGTVGRVARQLGREFIGIEIDADLAAEAQSNLRDGE